MTSTTEAANHELRVLKTGVCSSLSGKSKLTYQVGCSPASDLYLRIHKNSGSGYYSNDWVALERMHALLRKTPGKPITGNTLSPLFKGRSVNTAGFLLAALKHEKLVHPMPDRPRCYELLDGAAFMEEAGTLMKREQQPVKARGAPKGTGSPQQ